MERHVVYDGEQPRAIARDFRSLFLHIFHRWSHGKGKFLAAVLRAVSVQIVVDQRRFLDLACSHWEGRR